MSVICLPLLEKHHANTVQLYIQAYQMATPGIALLCLQMAWCWGVCLDEDGVYDDEITKLNIWKTAYAQFVSIEFLLLSVTTDCLHSTCCETREECNKSKWRSLCCLLLRRTHGEISARKMEFVRSVHSLMLLKINCH
jgi:hypothetical protein